MSNKRKEAIHAFNILNYFISDLVAASQVRRLFQSSGIADTASPETIACVNRMCISYLVLTLDKWAEFYDRFHRAIPEDCRAECKSLLKEIRRRKIKQFRDTFVGHIWDRKRRRPLTGAEIEALVEAIVENSQDGFSAWCNNPDRNVFPETVVSVVEHTRDRIREEFKLKDSDLFPQMDKAL